MPDLPQILSDVLDRSESDRSEFLNGACGNNASLRARVKSLIKAHEKADAFLAKPLVTGPAVDATVRTAISEGPGTVIDKYKLLQMIGEGGFGAVYMAEQREPVKRRVALKIIKLGMDTKQVIARFEAERQALAMMEHPNIARVLDAGATETGRPYFVMELVKGIPITEYCDQNNLSTSGRLDLFRDVCHAVQHAHQKGIIHRDIKPSNVLVTLHDGSPVPKVIDFGIAKATNQELTEKTVFTEFGQFIGTPVYMSPEQAEMSGLDVDTRSDIYSLGVLLYELLTGTTPFDNKTLRNAGYAEIQRVIREDEPPKPSQRVSTLGEHVTSVAKHRQIDPSDLRRILRGDLDWIVMKALEKDRTRRYATANDLASDVKRHMVDEPVLASPPSSAYKMRKFVRRNRGAVVGGSIVAAALLIGLALATVGFAQSNHQEYLTGLQATKANAVSTFLQDMLASVDPEEANGRAVSVQYVLDEASAEIDAGALSDQPDVEVAIRMTLGETYHALGLFQPAKQHWLRALDLSKRVHGDESAEVADSLHGLGFTLLKSFEPLRADPYLREALLLRRTVYGNESLEVAETLSALGLALWCSGRAGDAEPLYRDALEIQRGSKGEHRAVAATLSNLSGILQEKGDFVGADKLSREAISIEQELSEDDPWLIAQHLRAQALSLKRQGKYASAEQRYLESLQMYREHFGDMHPEVAHALPGLAWIYYDMGDYKASAAIFRDAVAMTQEIYGDEHILVMGKMRNLIKVLQAKGDWEEADKLLRDVLKMAQEVLTGGHPTAEFLHYLTSLLEDRERASMAEPVYRQALAIDRRVLGRDHPLLAVTLTNLAIVHEHQDEFDVAHPLLEEALALNQRVLGDQHPDTLDSAERLARLGGE